MVFLDAAFFSYHASFFTIFLENCGRGESLRTSTCHRSVSGGMQGYAPCKMHLLQQNLFFVSFEFHGDHKTVTNMG